MTLYSNEIVFRGHPDKVCDQISDALLTAYLQQDPNSRCGIEVVGNKGYIFIGGEVTTNALINVNDVVRDTLITIGYDPDAYALINTLGTQSVDIAQGVDTGGAGDQGMMFGYACNDTPEYVPTAMAILQEFAQSYDALRKAFPNRYYPDGKAQITGWYDEDFKLKKIKTFTISYQNSEEDRIYTDAIVENLALSVCRDYGIEIEEFLINPTGRFNIGGFEGDAGLTGRKIVVDNYHSFANVGGGAFSGKDPSKVDRSAAYKARQIAIRYLKRHNLKWCEVQLSYAIGVAEPLAIYIDSDVGPIIPDSDLYAECTPNNIINEFDLKNFNYTQTAKFGHFGQGFPWETIGD